MLHEEQKNMFVNHEGNAEQDLAVLLPAVHGGFFDPHGVPPRASRYSVRAYDGIEEMEQRESIQPAIVCNAHPFHAQAACAAIRAGAHVLVEKPLRGFRIATR